MQVQICFLFLVSVGALIPVIAWGLKISLRRYVMVEMVYDAVQGGVVAYFWNIDKGFLMREGEEMSRWVFMLSLANSMVDVRLIMCPTACFVP